MTVHNISCKVVNEKTSESDDISDDLAEEFNSLS